MQKILGFVLINVFSLAYATHAELRESPVREKLVHMSPEVLVLFQGIHHTESIQTRYAECIQTESQTCNVDT